MTKIAKKVWSEDSPLELARRLGESVAGDLGSTAIKELELGFATALLPKFADNPKLRSIQHILLYWVRGFYRSTMLELFSQTIPQDMGVVDITSTSQEKIFGSVDKDGNPIKPAFANKTFVVITELLSFLGSGWGMRDLVSTMNVVMECQLVTRHLLKLVQRYYRPDLMADLEANNVHWDPSEGVMSYRPRTTVLAASTLLPNKTYTYLVQSGFFGRFHILSHEFTDREVTEDWHKHRLLDLEALNNLRQCNEKLRMVKVHDLRMPSENFMKPIYNVLEAMVDDLIPQNPTLRKEEILNPRTKGNVIRELVGCSFIRTAHANGYRDIDKLDYTDADRNFILERPEHFIQFKVNPLFVEESIKPRMKKKTFVNQAKEFILDLLADKKLRGGTAIIQSAVQAIGCCTARAHTARKELEDHGKICEPRFGFYKLKEDCQTCNIRNQCRMIVQKDN